VNSTQAMLMLGAAPWRFASPQWLILFLAIPILAGIHWWTFIRQRQALLTFAGTTPQATRPAARRAFIRTILVSVGCSSLVIALARPQADPIEEDSTVRGRDIVFLLDVSRSMLSRDVSPSRLERAKLWIKDLTATLKGDRVGLVAFAGVPVVVCPLTLDRGFFSLSLEELSPATSPRGGTLIGDAIRKTLSDVFEPGLGRFRDIILITDGEDQGSFPVEAAQKAGELGVRIIALGIGSELEGSPVPVKDAGQTGYIEFEGQQVRSKLDSSTLAKITQAAAQARGDNNGGVFLNVGTGTINLEKVYRDLIASAEQRESQTKANVVYKELFPYFLGVSALLLAFEPLVRTRISSRAARVKSGSSAAVAAALLTLCAIPYARAQATAPADTTAEAPAAKPTASDNDPVASYNTGRELFRTGKFAEAAEQFRKADLGTTDFELSNRARFNLGQALLKQAAADEKADPAKNIQTLADAARAFRGALDVKPGDEEAARNVEIARRLMKDIERKQDQKSGQDGKQDSKDDQSDPSKKQDGSQGDSKKDQQSGKKDDAQKQKGDDQKGKQEQAKKEQAKKEQEAKEHQNNADDLKDLADRQSKAADKSQQAKDEQDAARKNEATKQSQAQQKDVNKDTQQQSQKMDQSKDPASAAAKDKLDQAKQEQKAADEALSKGDPSKAKEHQDKASQLLNQAAQSEQSAAEEAKKQAEQMASEQEEKERQAEQKAKEQEAKKDQKAQQLLDKERKQREARQQVLRALKGKPQPVERDW